MIVLIEREHGGQVHPYGDTVHSAFISIRRPELIGGKSFYQEISRELAEGLARLLVRKWDENPRAFGARLEKLEPVGPTPSMKQEVHPKWLPGKNSRWYVRVVEPYTD